MHFGAGTLSFQKILSFYLILRAAPSWVVTHETVMRAVASVTAVQS